MRDPEVESFLAVLAARRAPRTVEAYRRDLGQLATWLGKPVGVASVDDLNAYLAQLRADGLAPATISPSASCAAPERETRTGSCRSAARPWRRFDATSPGAGHTSIAATTP